MERMSAEQYRKMISGAEKKQTKYKNVKTTVDGIEFDSKAEARRYSELKILKRQGLISSFGRQPSFVFASGVRYRPDFIVWADGKCWVEDVKGKKTKDFIIKQKTWAAEYPDMELRVIE